LALPVALACNTAITPDCIKLLYNITDPTTAVAGNELGIFEGVNDKYAQGDLDDFFAAFALNIPLGTHPTLKSVE
jgi:tripeptidyl-peptidase-1